MMTQFGFDDEYCRAVACKHCGAEPGRKCYIAPGWELTVHRVRVDANARAMRKQQREAGRPDKKRLPGYKDRIEVWSGSRWKMATHKSDLAGGKEFIAQIDGGGVAYPRYSKEGKEWRWPSSVQGELML